MSVGNKLSELYVEFKARGMTGVKNDMNQLRRSMGWLEKTMKDVIASFANLTVAATGAAAAISVRDFANLESRMLDVAKTTGISGEQLRKLKAELIDMGARLTTPTERLMEITAAAGQVGIKGEENLLRFTEVVGKLADTSELSAEEAGLAMAKILNVGNIREATGEVRRAVISDIESLASAFTSLASSTAASEVELADVVMRLAPTGSTLGLALEDIAGIAATLKDVGMSNEIGGTAISRIFTEMLAAAGEGGEVLENFARTTGMTADEFKRLIENDPREAFVLFVESLSKLSKTEAVAALQGLQLRGNAVISVMLSLGRAADKMRQNMDTAGQEFREATALNAEYEAQSEGMWKQLQRLNNQSLELREAIGEQLAGGIRAATNELQSFLDLHADRVVDSLREATGKLVAAFGEVTNSTLATQTNVSNLETIFSNLAGAIEKAATALRLFNSLQSGAAKVGGFFGQFLNINNINDPGMAFGANPFFGQLFNPKTMLDAPFIMDPLAPDIGPGGRILNPGQAPEQRERQEIKEAVKEGAKEGTELGVGRMLGLSGQKPGVGPSSPVSVKSYETEKQALAAYKKIAEGMGLSVSPLNTKLQVPDEVKKHQDFAGRVVDMFLNQQSVATAQIFDPLQHRRFVQEGAGGGRQATIKELIEEMRKSDQKRDNLIREAIQLMRDESVMIGV